MKTACLALIIASSWVVSVRAQTNAQAIAFTNQLGESIRGEVFKVDPVRVIYKTGPSEFHSVNLSQLPEALRVKFGYDPEKERAFLAKEKARHAEQARRKADFEAQQNASKILQNFRESIEDTRTVIWARVIQRIDDNRLLIDSDSVVEQYLAAQNRPWINGAHWTSDALPEVENDKWHSTHHVATGTVLLIDYQNTKNTFDGQKFAIIAFPIGTFKYTTVLGAGKIVPQYTASIDIAMRYALTNQSELNP